MRALHGSRVLGMVVMGVGAALVAGAIACAAQNGGSASAQGEAPRVVPGITALLEDSIHLIGGRRIALIMNQTSIDADGNADVELLMNDPRAKRANVTVVRLFSPEHGIRGTADVTNLPDERDARSGLMVHSLYRRETMPPPDSLLRDVDALVFDLQDIGTRTWTYVGVMVYAMRAAARVDIPFVVLDRPNPLGGRMDGPFLDTALAQPEDPAPGRRGQAYALYPVPLRHGMTMGEMARFLAQELKIPVTLHVVPVRHYRRAMWWDDTKLPWIVPSPAMVNLASATIYPSLVMFESSNVSVGRGTDAPFQRIGAPWLDGKRLKALLDERTVNGIEFEVERFTPQRPTDNKYGGREIEGVRIRITDRDRVQSGRLAAVLLWAVREVAKDSLVIQPRAFDLRFGSTAAREAIMRGEDPDAVMDRIIPGVIAHERRVKPLLIYR